METSESIAQLAAALSLAQAAMTSASKDATNPFFKSKYADLGSVIFALKDAFAKNGLSFTQAPRMVGSSVGVTTRIMHKSGEYIQGDLSLPLHKSDPQAAGAAITYARRYALQSMAGLPAEDSDAEGAMTRTVSISPEQTQRITLRLKKIDKAPDRFCAYFGINNICDLPASELARAMSILDKGEKQANG
jgi:hypothetical protein